MNEELHAIVHSTKFLLLPTRARLLFFYLTLHRSPYNCAVDPLHVMRICGATSADLKALLEGGFVTSGPIADYITIEDLTPIEE